MVRLETPAGGAGDFLVMAGVCVGGVGEEGLPPLFPDPLSLSIKGLPWSGRLD